MENSRVTQGAKTFNFKPYRVWPESLPALTWEGHEYAGFGHERKSESLQVNQRFENAFFHAHPNIGLAQLSRFYHLSLPFEVDWTFFFSLYRLRYSDSLIQTLRLVRTLEPSFQQWIDDKGCGQRELSPLVVLNTEQRELLCRYIGTVRPAKSQGIQALEWATDLILLGRDVFASGQPQSFEQWYLWLKKTRYPERQRRLSDLEGRLRQAPWPRHVSAGPIEMGDRLAAEVRLVFSDPEQLMQIADQLKSCAQFLKQNSNASL